MRGDTRVPLRSIVVDALQSGGALERRQIVARRVQRERDRIVRAVAGRAAQVGGEPRSHEMQRRDVRTLRVAVDGERQRGDVIARRGAVRQRRGHGDRGRGERAVCPCAAGDDARDRRLDAGRR
jgi:hypothetical protein